MKIGQLVRLTSKWLEEIYLQNPLYWFKKLHFITGADSSHFRSALNLLESIEIKERSARVTFWDLGLSEEEITILRARFPNVALKEFDFSRYPAHMNIRKNAGYYAWKPVAIFLTTQELIETGDGDQLVIWADAGDVVTRRLTRLRGLISRFGMYTPKSPGKLLTWTHPLTLEILQIEQPLESRQNCNGALVAFDLSSRLATDLLEDWQMYAHREDCIAPQGHSALNHRWDQSILSCLVAKRNLIPSSFLLAVEAVGVKIHQDVE